MPGKGKPHTQHLQNQLGSTSRQASPSPAAKQALASRAAVQAITACPDPEADSLTAASLALTAVLTDERLTSELPPDGRP